MYSGDEYLNKLQIARRLILNLYGTYEALPVHARVSLSDAFLAKCGMKGIISSLIYRYRFF